MPRLGIGMPMVSDFQEAAVLVVDDFFYLLDVASEITPDFTGIRKNLLVQSQTFKTTWATNNAAIPNDLFEAPDNSLTAQAITASSSGASSVFVQQVVATTAGETYTYSAHVKAGANGFVLLLFFDGNLSRTAYFNAATGAASNTSDVLTTSFDKMDDDWVRVSITFQNTVTTSSSFVRIFSAAAAGSTATGAAFDAGTELLYIWGAQLEEDSRPTAYIVTTNAAVNVATNELNDVSSVWDFDGTDIMLEVDPENEGAFEEATANLVVNHDFAVDSNWTKGAGWTISGGKASNDGSFGSGNSFLISSESDASVGDTYEITFTVSNYVEGTVKARAGQAGGTARTANGTYTEVMVATSTETARLQATNSFTGSVDNVTIKEYAITPLNV